MANLALRGFDIGTREVARTRPNNVGTASLQESISRGRKHEALTNALRRRHVNNVENLGPEQRRLGAASGSAVQQKFRAGGGSFAKNLEQTIRRGKARQGIENRGDAAIRNQQLKDRLALVRESTNRRNTIQSAAANAERARSGLDQAQSRAGSIRDNALFGALGAVTGGAVRGFGDSLFGPDEPVDMLEEADVTADVSSLAGMFG